MLTGPLAGILSLCLFFYSGLSVALTPVDNQAVPQSADVVIIGAGLSGLITAHKLRNKRVIILEAEARIGGRVSTITYDVGGETIRTNEGMEEFWESNPILAQIEEFGLPVRLNSALSSFRLNGVLYAWEPGESKREFLERVFNVEELNSLATIEAQVEQTVSRVEKLGLLPPELEHLRQQSFADWVRGQKTTTRLAEWIRISVEPEVATEWSEISALDGMIEYRIFASKGEKTLQIYGGNQNLTDALATSVGADNIFTNVRVERVVSKAGRVTVFFRDVVSGRAGSIDAPSVVSTMPLPLLSKVEFRPALSAAKTAAIASLGTGTYLKVHVILREGARRFFANGHGGSILPILTDSPVGVVYEGNVLHAGKTQIVTLLLHGQHAKAFAELGDAAGQERLHAELEKLFPGISAEILQIHFLKRLNRTIAAWGVGRSRFDSAAKELRQPEHGVYLAGDFTESSHSDGAAHAAARVVRQLQFATASAVPLPAAPAPVTTSSLPLSQCAQIFLAPSER